MASDDNMTVHMGVLKPEYIQRAQQQYKNMGNLERLGHQNEAMARHPAARRLGRDKEFHASAQIHLEKAAQIGNELLANAATPAGQFTRRGMFHTAINSMYN